MRSQLACTALLLSIGVVTNTTAQLQAEGILEPVPGGQGTYCQPGITHQIVNQCFHYWFAIKSSTLDLTAFNNQYVHLEGPQTSDPECPTIDVQSISSATNSCQKEGFVEAFAGTNPCGQAFTHRIRNQCLGYQLNLISSTVDLDASVSRYAQIAGPTVGDEWGSCDLLDVQQVTPLPPCSLEAQNLQVHDERDTWLDWSPPSTPYAWAGTYDVIRGFIPEPVLASGHVDLGFVECLADGHALTSTQSGPRDSFGPLEGTAFFYLVRPNGAFGVGTYGYSQAGLERIPSEGDCP